MNGRLQSVAVIAILIIPANADGADLISRLEIPASTTDLFPGAGANVDRFGGFSDMFYHAATNKWYALPDRGPGGGVLGYENRVEEFSIDVNPATGAISNFQITRTIPFRTSDGSQAFNGLNPQLLNGSVGVLGNSFDPEGFAVGPSGDFYVSDEYGPSVYEFAPFDNAGQLEARFVRAFTLPANVIPRDAMSNLDYVAASPVSGRQGNRGFEGLAINPSGTKIYVTLQSPLRQEGTPNGASSRNGRIYEFDIASGSRSAEYLYQFDDIATINAGLDNPAAPGHPFPANQQGRFALSGITALSDTQFLVIERDSRGLGVANPYTGFDATGALDDVGIKKIYRIDIAGASDVQGSIIASNTGTGGFVPVAKSLYFDVDATLGAAGQITPEKFEGIAFGPDLANGSKLLLLGIDNDFSATQLVGSSTQYDIYTNGNAVRITPIDDPSHSFANLDPMGADLGPIPAGFNLLPVYLYSVAVPVPEPSACALMLMGAIVAAFARRREWPR